MTKHIYSDEDWFQNVETVITEPLKFKAKLGIGERAYTSLRLKNNLTSVWDCMGAAASGAGLASSATVASTFFAPNALLGALGIATASTPIGWIVAAGVVSGGTWLGLTKFLNKQTNNRVITIPEFINTPMDVLALAIFDLLAPLAFKIAEIDGEIAESEEHMITQYFVKQWGYDQTFISEACLFTKSKIDEVSIKDIATALATFKKENPDCDYESMTKDVLIFLKEIIEVDGVVDEREEMALERVETVFNNVDKFSVKKNLMLNLQKIKMSLNKLSSSKLRPS
jgi:uncharacterized tellurite resistance protein B-like protein